MKDIRSAILQLRDERHWSEYELANRSGVSQGTINAWYCQDRMPNITNLEKICDAFGITLSQFFAEDGDQGSLTKDQRELLDYWTRLPEDKREFVLELVKKMQS